VSGATGATGATGPTGPLFTPTVITNSITLSAGNGGGVSANCPAGYYAIGGGAESMTKLPTGIDILATNPVYSAGSAPSGWYANGTNRATTDIQLKSYVICMPSS
jgi:hypothetical protein